MTARRLDGEDGAYLVLYALAAVALFSVAAMVLDLAALRDERAGDRLAADLALTAGAVQIRPADPSSVVAACQTTWDYFVANRRAGGDAVSAPDCATAFAAICDPTMPRTATGAVGDHQLRLVSPVPDDHPFMAAEAPAGDVAQLVDPAVDGAPCDRLGVEVITTRATNFAGVFGVDEQSTAVHSVARAVAEATVDQVTEAVVLDATGCDAVSTTGTGGRLVLQGVAQPGELAIDSTGSACGTGYVLDVADADHLEVQAPGGVPGTIRSRALAVGDPTRAFDPTDAAAGRLVPTPVPAVQATGRSPADARWKVAVDAARATLGGPGAPVLYDGMPFSTWLGACDVAADTVFPAGNWWIPCPTFRVAANATFGGGAIVFAGTVDVADHGCLAVGHPGCGGLAPALTDSVVYLRTGDLLKLSTRQLYLERTFVHLTGSAATTDSGRLRIGPDFASGGSVLHWTAPLAGPFEDLLLWAESGGEMTLGGQGTTVAEGALFAPNARLTVAARPGGTSMATQLVVGRLRLEGGATLTLAPSAARAVTDQVRSVRLVR